MCWGTCWNPKEKVHSRIRVSADVTKHGTLKAIEEVAVAGVD